MPRSMTGFARQESHQSWGKAICEIRSVNHRYLEPSLRMPDTLRNLEPSLREELRRCLSRGKVEISFSLKTDQADSSELSLNESLARDVARLAQEVQQTLQNPAPLSSMDILKWPGVVQAQELDQKLVEESVSELFSSTLQQLISNREREGAELGKLIEQRLDVIGEHVQQLRERMPELLANQNERLRSKLEALNVDVDEDRFTQEVVYLAQKADVAEELDRLETHLGEVRRTLGRKDAIGRRLDFLMQELNREANTLSSKSISSETSQAAVDLKVLTEQMREQVQNIE
jgi:uncharacterized protein (TIGR00255 family)